MRLPDFLHQVSSPLRLLASCYRDSLGALMVVPCAMLTPLLLSLFCLRVMTLPFALVSVLVQPRGTCSSDGLVNVRRFRGKWHVRYLGPLGFYISYVESEVLDAYWVNAASESLQDGWL